MHAGAGNSRNTGASLVLHLAVSRSTAAYHLLSCCDLNANKHAFPTTCVTYAYKPRILLASSLTEAQRLLAPFHAQDKGELFNKLVSGYRTSPPFHCAANASETPIAT